MFHGDAEKAREFLASPVTRIGWIYQQLLKLYAPFVIPGISSNVLVLRRRCHLPEERGVHDIDWAAYFHYREQRHQGIFRTYGQAAAGIAR